MVFWETFQFFMFSTLFGHWPEKNASEKRKEVRLIKLHFPDIAW